MFQIKEKDGLTHIYLVRGDTLSAQLEMKYGRVDYEPIVGDEIVFTMKSSKMNSDRSEYMEDEPLVEINVDPSDLILTIEPEDTAELKFKDYDFNIRLTSDGVVDTFIRGVLHLLPETFSNPTPEPIDGPDPSGTEVQI